MKKGMICAAALVAGVCASGVASAQGCFGPSDVFDHLNRGVPKRGACTQLPNAPTAPPGSPWFCNYSSGNPLYNQINSLLEKAATIGTQCVICTNGTGPDGHHRIDVLECPPN